MTILSKTTGGLSLISCIYDMHKCAVSESNKGYTKASANRFVSNEINSMRSDEFSYKDAQIKNWYAKNDFFQSASETLGRVTGYVKGFVTAGKRYIPNFIAAGIALLSKRKGLANAAAGVLAVFEGWNFIKNTTGIKQRNDYLKM